MIISAAALDVKLKDGSKTLLKAIEEAMANAGAIRWRQQNHDAYERC